MARQISRRRSCWQFIATVPGSRNYVRHIEDGVAYFDDHDAPMVFLRGAVKPASRPRVYERTEQVSLANRS